MDMKLLEQLIAKGGTTAQKLLASGMKVDALRTNATLRKDEWKHYDTAVLKAARQRLVGINRLRAAGLVYSIANGLGKTVLEYENSSDNEAAQVSMDGVTRGRNDRMEYDLNYLPLPIIHKDYQLSIRELNASRQTGEALDTTMAEMASRKVAEKIETHMFQGTSTFTYGGGTITGLLDATNRNTGSLAYHWNDSGATGATITTDVLNMKQASITARHYGPWMLWIPTNFETAIDADYVSGYPKTIRNRIKEIAGIIDVEVADLLTADNVILCQMTSDVIRQVEGLPITNLEWNEQGGMIFNFKVMTISVTQCRSDQDSRSGITHFTK